MIWNKYLEHLQIVRRHEHDQKIQRQLCTVQTTAQTSLSCFLPPYNDSCSYYTMGNALKQLTMVSHFY
jgi:hypothetical protein